MASHPLLLLWDVDGTLVRGAAVAHGRALKQATVEAIGREVPKVEEIDPGGRTDREIVRVLAEHAGIGADEFAAHVDSVIVRAEAIYEETVEADLSHTVLPDVPEVLAGLSGRSDVAMGIVTGNIRRVAELKLGAAGIARHIEFECGGFGGELEQRSLLPGLARGRAGEVRGLGSEWPRERTVVIGDTARDIACARADGVGVVCVATGPQPLDALTEADHAFASLGEALPLLTALAEAG